jgi:hypothetical protein
MEVTGLLHAPATFTPTEKSSDIHWRVDMFSLKVDQSMVAK